MEHKNSELGELKVVGMQIETSVQECQTENKMPKLWEEFIKKVANLKNRKGHKYYGVCITTGECSFRYIAGVEVENFDDVPEGMVSETVAPSKYAVFLHKGKIDKLNQTYGDIMKYVGEKGIKQKKTWLEVYDERFKHGSDDSEFDIYVAVE